MDEYLWPARNVAEFAYCPRLFYLMEVEGIHLPSVDTEQGMAVHRRVDRASAADSGDASEDNGDADECRPRAVRSLTLTSRALSLTATLDLAEIEGETAVPVEYRKGRPFHEYAAKQDDPGEQAPAAAVCRAWPTDRVQVGLQAILLEEAGYVVREAVLYYAGEKLRLRLPVDDALRREAMDALHAAQAAAAARVRPLPLLNDSKCLRCSLQPFCLPDEVNQQRMKEEEGHSPRRIWPSRDDGLHVVAQEHGVKIGINGMALKVTDKEGKVSRKIPLAGLESLAVLGGVQVSTQALHALADRSIPVAFMSAAGRLIAMVDPLDSVSADIRREQVRGFDQPARCLELARALIVAKIINQRVLLQRNNDGVAGMVLEDLLVESERARDAGAIDVLRGHEGQAAALYFGEFAGMFKTPVAGEFDANGRQRRPPPDPINAVLSFAYTMLAHECVSALRLARLEPTLGAFHTCRPGRPALALDLMEPFRPLIADSVAVSCFNRGELTEGHFQRTAAGCALSDSGRRAFFGAWGRRMDTEITHPTFGYKLSYRRMLMLHARMIAAWLLGEVPTLAFLTTR
ncbi:MAG TPA: CRISPR-associated endonuclease Cas1 [Tepidisphaeraceae bacterium]|nr:CRISPR-associated endonuclease Cas1 [Tepidisphaeraceae bacterium]